MNVIGIGSPDELRIRFDGCQLDVLVDVLREQRADATRDAADAYTTGRARPEAVDDRHDRLRALERLLMQLEEQPPDNRPGAVLTGDTELMSVVARDGAQEALRRLADAHVGYEDATTPESADALIAAATTAKAWVATLTAVDSVDRAWGA